MDNNERRWLEIQFYYFCYDLMRIRNNIVDVMNFIDCMKSLGNTHTDYIQLIAQELLTSIRYRPTRKELTILATQFGVPAKRIKARTEYCNRTHYEALKEDIHIYPRLSLEKDMYIKEIIDIINIIKGAGII